MYSKSCITVLSVEADLLMFAWNYYKSCHNLRSQYMLLISYCYFLCKVVFPVGNVANESTFFFNCVQ